MTKNEVELHKNEKGNTGLIIVSKIKLNRDPASPTATGGSVESLLGWDIDQWVTEPIAFQVSRHWVVAKEHVLMWARVNIEPLNKASIDTTLLLV